MASFEFRLDVVRDLRRRARDLQINALSRSIAHASAAANAISRFAKQLDDAAEYERDGKHGAALDMAALRSNAYFATWLTQKIEQSRARLSECEILVSEERGKLAKATAQWKAIERLREKRWKMHVAKTKRVEQSATDEFGARSFALANTEELQPSC